MFQVEQKQTLGFVLIASVSVTSYSGSELPSLQYITGLEGLHPSYLNVALQQAVNDKA